MTTYQETVAVEVTIAEQAWGRVFGAAMESVADCFVRREARRTVAELTAGLLLELDTRNCWTLAEALGHPGPHRLQHLLSRARFDHEQAREQGFGVVAGRPVRDGLPGWSAGESGTGTVSKIMEFSTPRDLPGRPCLPKHHR